MRCSDIMLSVLLHAGIVAGVMYGISHYESDPVEDEIVEPMFFEILEESVIAAASVPEEPDESKEKEESAVRPDPVAEEPEPEEIVEKEIDSGPERTDVKPVEAAEESVQNLERKEDAIEDAEDDRQVREQPENQPPVDSVPEVKGPEEPEKPADEAPALERIHSPKEDEASPDTAESPDSDVTEVKPQEEERAKIVSEPSAIGRIVPRYPRSARRRGREGNVTLEISVSDSGKVTDAVVVSGSGHRDLDAAAVSAVRSAQFAPATEDGIKVEGHVRLTFEFRLR